MDDGLSARFRATLFARNLRHKDFKWIPSEIFVYAQGHVARIRVWPNNFDVLVAGTNVWFRIGFHVDLAKWAYMEGKTIFVQGAEEAGDNCFVADYFHTN